MNVRSALICIILFMPLAAGAKDVVTQVDADDQMMHAAIQRARSEVELFIKILRSGNTEVSVKVPVNDGRTVEHFWLKDVGYSSVDGRFTGKIDNDPNDVKGIVLGQRVSIQKSEISDWLYMQSGRMYGNYTLRALLPRMPKARADALRKVLSDD